MNCEVGTRTLPPRWPHFFSDASWSSKCTPAAPASIIALHQLEGVEVAAEAGLGVGDDRDEPVAGDTAFGMLDLVGANQRSFNRFTSAGTLFAG